MKKKISIILICFLTLSSIINTSASAKEEKVYYLFGYINGANYACEEDYQNMGEYCFTDGKLTARFDKVSYVAVKEADNANWYMTDGWMGDVHSVKLYNTNITGETSDKLKVPEGVDVNFVLTDNGDGSLTLSYTAENEGYPIRAQLWDYVYIEIQQIINSPGNNWTEETEKPFLKALKEAKEVLEDNNATDKQLVNAYDNLKTAEKNLKVQDKEYWTQKLISLTDEYSMDFENTEFMYTIYTKASFDNYFEAYKEANESLGNSELFWFDLSRAYYNLKDSRKNLVRLDGKDNDNLEKPFYKSDDFITLLKVYGKEIGIGENIIGGEDYERERVLDGKTVIEYRGLRIFNDIKGINVFALSDMLCTVGEEVIDGYKFSNPVYDGGEKNKTGLCVYANGKILSIKDAVSSNIVTAEELSEVIPFTEKGGTIPTLPTPAEKQTTAPVTLPIIIENPTMPVVIPDDTGKSYYPDGITGNNDAETTENKETVKPTENASETEQAVTVEPTEAVTETVYPATYEPTEPTTKVNGFNATEPEKAAENSTANTVEPTELIIDKPTEAVEAASPSAQQPVEIQETIESHEEKPVTYKISKKANPVKVKAGKKTIKAKNLKKKKVTVKPITIKNAKGTVNVVKVKKGTPSNIFKKITVNSKTGAITFKKGKYAKKTYSIKLKITVKGNKTYKGKTLSKTVKIKIK